MDTQKLEHNGLPCRVVLTSMGHRCGYVGVPDGHPWHGKSYNEPVSVPKRVLERPIDVDKVGVLNVFCAALEETQEAMERGELDLVLAVDVHGGLTWSDSRPASDESDPDATWWLGFDCAHAGDHPSVQDGEYVANECRSLADQIVAAAEWDTAPDLDSPVD